MFSDQRWGLLALTIVGMFISALLVRLLPAPAQAAGRAHVSVRRDAGAVVLPEFVGSSGGAVQAVVARGTLAFFGQGGALVVLDLAGSGAPMQIARLPLRAAVDSIQLLGDLLYVANDTSGLLIVDVSDPRRPALRGSYQTPGVAYGVYAVGSLAYVAAGRSGLVIIDASDSAAPRLLGSLDTRGNAHAVEVVDNRAYIAGGTAADYRCRRPRAPPPFGQLGYIRHRAPA
jgi:hypothetical protein